MLKFFSSQKKRIIASLLKFANNPYAKTTIFIHSIADSSILPISVDITFVPISIALPKKSFVFALWATIGSLIGGIISYFIGMELMSVLGQELINIISGPEVWDEMLTSFRGDLALWTLVVAAITPLPYSLACMASGVVELDFTTFVIISVAGRTFRFFLIAALVYLFGPAVQVFLDKYTRQLAIFFITAFIITISALIFL